MFHGVQSIRVLHTNGKVILIHNLWLGFHIERLFHIIHDFFKIKRFFILFVCLFYIFVFAFIFFLIYSVFLYFFHFKFESDLILSIQYSLVKSWRRCDLANICSSTSLLPKNSYKSIGSNVKRPCFLFSKFLKSIICTFVPFNLIFVSEVFFVGEL